MEDKSMNELETRRALESLRTATVFDAMGRKGALNPHTVRPLWSPLVLAGPAFTVETSAADNLALHRAVADAPPGAVIVAVTQRSYDVAIFGDLLARICVDRGILGLITDGSVRDLHGIRTIGFPVFSGGTSVFSPSKEDPGVIGGTVVIEGVGVAPGDWMLADEDGVLAIPRADLETVVEQAYLRADREAQLIRGAAEGQSTLDQLGLTHLNQDRTLSS
jgi:4-hydroxy-4-methyl-2-oxoglutarate aldolase